MQFNYNNSRFQWVKFMLQKPTVFLYNIDTRKNMT